MISKADIVLGHDLLEGCAKLWLLIIIEHLFHCNWFSWEALEQAITRFPYQDRDANSRPPALLASKMKVKATRKVIGTFREIENFIRSFPQLLFNHIQNTQDEFWLFLIEIRRFQICQHV